MIWILILLTIKKMISRLKRKRLARIHTSAAATAILLLFLTGAPSLLNAQQERVQFQIQRGNSVLGQINMVRSSRNDSVVYRVNNTLNFRFITRFEIEANESSIFLNDQLVYSEINRKINGTKKTRVHLAYNNGCYTASKGAHSLQLPQPVIASNLIVLYFKEPYDGMSVYCDYQRNFSRVTRVSEGCYRVDLNQGAHNLFYYKNGRCHKVIAVNPLFKVQLIRKDS